ncbi:thioredoxin family protein [Lacticaseibacillus thailandensis]|uniref:Thioredoxin n=1 Tax=Lacticaseibacillus thailandensis DSM 22698 = JCM 13996 TaxID=1423810 RepID=A0A0R2CGA1_9LACO|nr:thioredoxin family protein [Lacticaseibacillus thailandensis]KRM87228.1 thioredoxin [Lacticaseibacillus thailandensis DSM 22698 = JCM 13996]
MEMYKPTVVSDDAVRTELNKPGKQVMFMTADWCGDCKAIKPFVQQIKEHAMSKGAGWVDVDRDANIEIAKEQGLKGIPAFVLFEDGKQINHIGNGERLNPKQVTDWVDSNVLA